MEVYSLPITGSSKDIKDSFLKQLSLKVNVEGPPVTKLQAIIFKPAGRPLDEFDNLIRVFSETGGRLDEDKILITAIRKGGSPFEAPSHAKFKLQTSVHLTDENKFDSWSQSALDKIADLLIQNYGYQAISRENVSDKVVLGKAEFSTEPIARVEAHKENIHTPPQEQAHQKGYVEELERKLEEVQKELICTKGNYAYMKDKVEELEQKVEKLQQEHTRVDGNYTSIKGNLEDLDRRVNANQLKITHVKEDVDANQLETTHVKEDVEELREALHRHQTDNEGRRERHEPLKKKSVLMRLFTK